MPYKNHEDFISYLKEYNFKRKEKQSKYFKEYRKKNRIRLNKKDADRLKNPIACIIHKTRYAVSHAIRAKRLSKSPCEICGIIKVQAHHDDYNFPLKVRWLCLVHHTEWHKHNTAILPKGIKNG